jgi:hypothetical protein
MKYCTVLEPHRVTVPQAAAPVAATHVAVAPVVATHVAVESVVAAH